MAAKKTTVKPASRFFLIDPDDGGIRFNEDNCAPTRAKLISDIKDELIQDGIVTDGPYTFDIYEVVPRGRIHVEGEVVVTVKEV